MKKLVLNFLNIITVLLPLVIIAQDLPTIIPPPPSVVGIMNFEDVPIDYYTGQPNISLPLYKKSISRDLNYPLVLNYNTMGLRVDQRSGWTGTGWSMASAGTITRTIKGLPDETNDNFSGKGIYHNNYLNYSSLSPSQKEEFLWKSANGKGGEKMDTDYDIYQYNYLGGSGRFLITKNQGVLEPIIIESQTNDQIFLSYDVNFKITRFEIIDIRGYIYTFIKHNENLINSYTTSTSQFGGNSSTNTDFSWANNVPNTWYLEDIKNSNNEILCSFSYQTIQENYDTPSSVIRNSLISPSTINYMGYEAQNKGMLSPSIVSSNQSIYSNQKYINEVVFRDGVKLKYILDPNGHIEYGGGAKLNSIQVEYPNDNVNKQYDFSYQTNTKNRLFLTGITEIAGGEQNNYIIDYNDINELEGFNSKKKDKWGYYHGVYSDNTTATISLGDPEKATTGAIKSITFPTGGKKEFVFESNSYGYEGNQVIDPLTIPSNRISQNRTGILNIDSYTQVSTTKLLLFLDIEQNTKLTTTFNASSGVILNKHILSIAKAQPKSGTNISDPIGTVNYNNYNISDFEYVSNLASYDYPIANSNFSNKLNNGWYIIELRTPTVYFSSNPTNLTVNFTLTHSAFQHNTSSIKGGGIRIKEILFTEDGLEKKKISYDYYEPYIQQNPNPITNLSSGSFEVNSKIRTYTKGKTHPFINNIICTSKSNMGFVYRTPHTVNYKVTRSINEIITPNTKGNYVGYKTVKRTESGNGSELFTYISPIDYQIQTAPFLVYPFKPLENLDYKRGKLEKKELFDESGKLLKEENYSYTDINEIAATSTFPFEAQLFDCPWDQFYELHSHYINNWVDNPSQACGASTSEANVIDCSGGQYSDMTTTTYNHIRGILLPQNNTTKEYFYSSSGVQSSKETRQEFTYNTSNYQVATQNTYYKVKGIDEHLESKYFYPVGPSLNSNSTTNKNKLIASNKVTEVLESQSFRNNNKINETHNIYYDFDGSSNNLMLPKEVKVGKATLPPEKRMEFLRYDNYGNPTEVKKTNGTTIIYVYGFNGSVPVAKITNGNYTSVQNTVGNSLNVAANLTTAQENSLRSSLPNAMISFYRYDPLKGVTSTVDDKGYTTTYEYDAFNRLKRVKDAQGKILNENTYHYKNQ